MIRVAAISWNQSQSKNNRRDARNNPSFAANLIISKEAEEIANRFTTYREPINKVKGRFACIKKYSKALIQKRFKRISTEELQDIRQKSFTRSLFTDSSKALAEDFQKRTKSILAGEIEIFPAKTISKDKDSSLVCLKYTTPNGEVFGPTHPASITDYVPNGTEPSSLKNGVENIIHDLASLKHSSETPIDFHIALHDVKLDRAL